MSLDETLYLHGREISSPQPKQDELKATKFLSDIKNIIVVFD